MISADRARVLREMSGDLTALDWSARLGCDPSDVESWCRTEGLPLAPNPNRAEVTMLCDAILADLFDYGAADVPAIAEWLDETEDRVHLAVDRLRRRGVVHDLDGGLVAPGRREEAA